MAIDPIILKRAEYWASNAVFDDTTRSDIQKLISDNDEKELTDRFYRDLEFGTGGMRGILGAGTARMNIYNVRKASTALAMQLKAAFKGETLRVGLTYDSRRYSRDFAKVTAQTMAAHGITALITKELRPVPMLSFMVREYGCHGGVCITASHNPPNYNGYKVYWKTGGQIVPPHDKAVIKNYQTIDGYHALPLMTYEEGLQKGLIREIGEELDSKYFARVEGLSLRRGQWPQFKVVFTPLHGTAGMPVMTMLKKFGFSDVHIVPEQAQPDENFPTVKFPNPEEPEALSMAVALARKLNADLVLGTDPDCDRLGVVVNEGGEFIYLNGNQIGSLLIDFVLSSLKDANKLPANPLVIKTIVTTDMQTAIGHYYGAEVEETLTGFKWICDRIEAYESGALKPYRKYVCGGEESYGFLMDTFVRDKDGVMSCAIAAEMTAYYKSKGLTLTQVLDQIFRRHGVYQESLHTVTLPGKEGADKIIAMMERLRKDPPCNIGGVAVEFVRDIKVGKEYACSDEGMKETRNLGLPSSDVLQFVLADGSKISVRPSGTEPKIKFYVSAREAVNPEVSDTDLEKAKIRCTQRVKGFESFFVDLATRA